MLILRTPPSAQDSLTVGSEEHRRAWLPVLGPAAYLLALELVTGGPDRQPEELARALGIRPRRVAESIDRLRRYGHLELGRGEDSPALLVATTVSRPARAPARKFDPVNRQEPANGGP